MARPLGVQKICASVGKETSRLAETRCDRTYSFEVKNNPNA